MFDPSDPRNFADFVAEFTIQTALSFVLAVCIDEVFARITNEFSGDSKAIRFSFAILQMLVNAMILYVFTLLPVVKELGIKRHLLNTTAGLTFSATWFGMQGTMISNFKVFNTKLN